MRALLSAVALVTLVLPLAAQQSTSQQMAPPDDEASLQTTHKATAQLKLPPSKTPPGTPLTPRERATQLLNRFTYGARPGDVERVIALGSDKWFEQQLTPATIPDPVMDRRLNDYPTINMTAEQLLSIFPARNAISLVAQGKRPYPADPIPAATYQAQVYKFNAEQDNRKAPHPEPSEAELAAIKKADQATASRIAGELFALPRKERLAAFEAMPVADRIAFANNLPGDQRNVLFADFTPRERDAINAIQGGVGSQYRIADELAQAHILRAILSERQLQEVMTDFWFNHFNIYLPKDSDEWYTTVYEHDTIRPHALGKFRDLLLATAQSPAMMIYLDNWLSVGPDSIANGVDPKNPNAKRGNKGLNENYGREVMELHTVGVNGGYSQADVTHLSAILTGWGVDRPDQGGPFNFDPKRHEPGPKDWFGYTIDDSGKVLTSPPNTPAGALASAQAAAATAPEGMKQGIVALSLLASAPQTAHFISYLLAQRFVADVPPPALVDRMAASYLASDGDIKAVLRTLIASPEFNSHRYFRNKVKTPSEFLASAFRATATDPQNPGALVNLLGKDFGQPLYRALPPTGYYMTADVWMNTQALLARLNFADQLTHNRFANQKFDAPKVLAFSLMSDRNPGAVNTAFETAPGRLHMLNAGSSTAPTMGPDVALRVLEGSLIGGEISPGTDNFIHSQLQSQPPTNPTETLNLLTALLLGSSEFQLR
jgi:uncharacterized protein (DUF1800 family)